MEKPRLTTALIAVTVAQMRNGKVMIVSVKPDAHVG